MTRRRTRGSQGIGLCAATLVLAAAATVWAQSLSTPTFTNSSNPDELVPGTSTTPSRERETAVNFVSSSSGAFTTHFTSLVTVDSDGASASPGVESLAADYTIDFTVSAPGAYVLTVDTHLAGDMNLVNDGPGSASVDVSGVSATFSGGTLATGSLDLPDPGAVSGSAGGTIPIDESGSATIFGVSNGAVVPHSLHFVFTQVATSSANGDEAAIRLGETSNVSTETAGDYPGTPARTQADDGHFVSVTLTSLCGNGTIDTGPSYTEDCDDGPANGTAASCCATTCAFKPDGTACDDNDACSSGETCTSGVCGGGALQTCPLCQTCSPMGGCVIGPRTACKAPTLPGKSTLQLKDKTPDSGDQVVFKWNKGEATQTTDFGDPLNTDDYALCVFDSLGGLLLKSDAPAGGVCGTKPCWKALGIKGFGYKDSLRTPDGADKILLKAGLAGKAKTQFKAKGDNIQSFSLPLSLPVTAQIQSENGQCWAATFSATSASKNDGTQFKGKSD
jgi:hypothetical protein